MKTNLDAGSKVVQLCPFLYIPAVGVDVHDAALVARRGLASERRDARHWRRVGQCDRSVVSEEPREIEMSARGEVIVIAAA